jgi:hypothetical protein
MRETIDDALLNEPRKGISISTYAMIFRGTIAAVIANEARNRKLLHYSKQLSMSLGLVTRYDARATLSAM